MRTIYPLSTDTISKIAAGEVVERPASIIKELIENALDARATHVDIVVEKGGAQKIIVRDNGKGMSKEDLEECYKPHTTSKIKTDEDLFNILSFGFRGEALASISTVSRMTIKSRQSGTNAGYEIRIDQGKAGKIAATGIPEGTEITIESLFSSTPARRKFLKDPKIEIRYIADLVTRFALAHPHVGFTLMHDGKISVDLPAHSGHHDRIRSVLGEDIAAHSLPINHRSSYGTLSGYIGKPNLSSHTRTHHYLFVNNRVVTDLEIIKTITETYGNLLEPRASVPFVLFLDVLPETVDVNIHPRKETIAFSFPKGIHALIEEGVMTTLAAHDLTYRRISDTLDRERMDFHMARILRDAITPWNLKPDQEGEIAHIHNLYIIAQTKTGVLVIDQHSAHERILYEQFKQTFTNTVSKPTSVELTQPIVFDISAGESLVLTENLETFQKIGFDIEPFGGSTFRIAAVPELFKNRDLKKLIPEVLADIKDGKMFRTLDRETERTLSYLACKTAIKAGDPLSQEERKRLVEKLLESNTLYTCPHGRPTHIEISLKELDRMFKRR